VSYIQTSMLQRTTSAVVEGHAATARFGGLQLAGVPSCVDDRVFRSGGADVSNFGQLRSLRPRNSYAFTTDVHGNSHVGGGVGLFFIWVDPKAPIANNNPKDTLLDKYKTNVSNWGALYNTTPTVFNGAQCLAAVAQASMSPEFHNVHKPQQFPHAFGPGDLLTVYINLVKRQAWIQCVDIARIAIIWLGGGGSTYLDTDMEVGSHRLPLELVSTLSEKQMMTTAASTQASLAATYDSVVPRPLVLFAQGMQRCSNCQRTCMVAIIAKIPDDD
jgi:hypothetical protein